MATVNLSVNVGENKTITFHSGGTYNPEDIVFDVSANGSGYKPIQTAVSSPDASSTTSTTFIDTISQNANGVITATKKTLPTASSTIAGITKVGATGGAAAYSHTHTLSVESSNDASQITLTHNTKFKISAGGSSYVFTTPSLPFASSTVTGITKLGAAGGAATYDHTHATSIATSTGTSQITLAFGNKYAITAGGSSYIFTMPESPSTNANTTYTFATGDSNGQIKVTPSSGSAYNVSVKGLGSAAYTESNAYATSTHTHGYITNTGGLSYNTLIGDGDCLVITDTSDSAKMKRTSITFGTSKTKFLRNDGTWATPLGSTSGGTSTPNHEHDLSIVADSNATNQITLAHNTKYKLSAGGSEYVFTTPNLPTATSSKAGITKVGGSGGAASYSHTHGSITNVGAISGDTTIASGDHLVITDTSDGHKIKRTSITFGTSTSTYLRNDGTWGTPSGGGGGSTVSANNITLSTSAQTYVTVDGTSKTIKLPSTSPWNIDVPLATPMFDGNGKGSVIPIAKVTNSVEAMGDVKPYYDISPVLMFPISIEDDRESYALPVYMDAEGHLFILLNRIFAEFLRNNMKYSTSSEYSLNSLSDGEGETK